MAFVDHARKVIVSQVVYWGPHGSGKTSNLRFVWERTKAPGAQWVNANPGGGPSYERLPMSLGEIRGYRSQFELVAAPGDPTCAGMRAELLERVDGVVFVADARRFRFEENAASLAELRAMLPRYGFALEKLPLVVQANMRDLPGSDPAAQLVGWLGVPTVPAFDAIAPRGVGVFDALKAACKLVLTELKKGA